MVTIKKNYGVSDDGETGSFSLLNGGTQKVYLYLLILTVWKNKFICYDSGATPG